MREAVNGGTRGTFMNEGIHTKGGLSRFGAGHYQERVHK